MCLDNQNGSWEDATEFSHDGLRSAGFHGFIPFSSLDIGRTDLAVSGVYAVLRPEESSAHISETSTAFWHRGRNPAYPLSKLQRRWDLATSVLYIGKAGGMDGGTTLGERLDLYRRYGKGENATHRGGRGIWQVEDAANQLLICWTATPGLDPECVEDHLLTQFERQYHVLPLANQRRGKKCKHQPLCRWAPATAAEAVEEQSQEEGPSK